MRVLYNGAWGAGHRAITQVSCEDISLSSPTLHVVFYAHNRAPHFLFYGVLPGEILVDLTFGNRPCTFESREAFILALAIELQSRYDAGVYGYSMSLKDKIEQLRIEYLQPEGP